MDHLLLFVFVVSAFGLSGAVGSEGGASEVVVARMDGLGTSPIQVDSLPEMAQISLCLRVKLLQWSRPSFVLTYAMNSTQDLYLAFVLHNRSLFIRCCDGEVELLLRADLTLFVWHHVCVSLDLVEYTLLILLDDKVFSPALRSRTAQGAATLPGGGRLLLGQRDATQANTAWDSLRGEMAEFRLYNTSLPRDQLQEYVACREMDTAAKPLLSFDDLSDFTVKSAEIFSSVARGAVCQSKPYRLNLVTLRLSFEEARKVCGMLGGNLASVPSPEETQLIAEGFSEFRQQCATPRNTFYWLGLQFDRATKAWLDIATSAPVLSLGFSGDPTFHCASAGSPFPPSWQPTSCEGLTCPLCNVTRHSAVLLRGLCKASAFDRTYSAYGYHNGKPAFEGFQSSRLVWDNATWVLFTRVSRDTTARLNFSQSSRGLPFGHKTWAIEGDNCGQSKATLLLTPCAEGQFTCSDFACVPIALRCDRSSDCADNSDEEDCQKVLLGDGYSKSIPPPSMSASTPLTLNLTFAVTAIREFSLVGFRISLDAVLRYTWRDARLTFANLHNNSNLNDIKVG
ncbi:low-density lipoprotein receptor-related protein 2 [Penaeus vannamei]|uniref:Low-density lipoprotein receptor-related protein 2 n=1 Tax=Penaeus vannamei TaxID=6689 RepID=A0A423SAZ0_PENVA|nr:low-density lipoprotein receptor-related protein 2 [Penaeus vannamei]